MIYWEQRWKICEHTLYNRNGGCSDSVCACHPLFFFPSGNYLSLFRLRHDSLIQRMTSRKQNRHSINLSRWSMTFSPLINFRYRHGGIWRRSSSTLACWLVPFVSSSGRCILFSPWFVMFSAIILNVPNSSNSFDHNSYGRPLRQKV
jgi:hypothetical protein